MKTKVTLRELVGTKIIYAVLLVCYYWMWARRDWHDYYTTIQNVVCAFTILFFAIIAFSCGVTFIDGRMAGYALVGTILVLTVIRFIIFCVMDSKGV